MNLSQIPLILYIACGALYWLAQMYLSLRVMKSVPRIKDLSHTGFTAWPKLSVIVTACNEAATIEAAIQTRLRDDYPHLEIIVVDDRSTDGTSEIVDRLAATVNGSDPNPASNNTKCDINERPNPEDNPAPPRRIEVKVVHNKELPLGWLGKLHAMDLGVKHATGDWFLFSDADVHIKPDTLKRVIAHCESRGLDHLAVLPEIWPVEFFLDTVLSFFVRMISLGGRIWAIENPRSKASIGCGAFNLVRRTAFQKTPGFEWLKMEVVDDAALGQMLKRSGARSSLANGRDYVGVYFYHSLREMAIGSERPFYTLMGNFSGLRLMIFAFLLLGVELAPFITLFLTHIPGLSFAGVIFTACAISNSILINKWLNRPALPAAFIPAGAAIMAFIIFRAGILGAKRKGIIWRGTFYPNQLLKEGKRYKM